MADINTNVVVLSGRLTQDPELRPGKGDGDPSSEFTIAVNGFKERVEFIRCKSWGAQAETLVQWCQKGRKLTVVGTLRREQWESEGEDGKTRKHDRTLVQVRHVEFGEKPQEKKKEETEDAPW